MTVRVKRQSNGRAIVLSVAVEGVETEASVDRLRAVVVAVGAWLLHVGALSLAPLSIVQTVMSGGIVFLAVLGERYFGFRLGRWQWVGVTITAAGLAVIGFTGGGATRPQRSSLAAMIAVEGAIVAVAATCWRSRRTGASCIAPRDCSSASGRGRCSASLTSRSRSSPTPRARSTGC
jgi:hypothetical protein